MKKTKIFYWASTAIVSAFMVFSAYLYLTSPDLKGAFEHLGFSDTFRIELAIAKLLGAVALLLPVTPQWGRQFAYFGFTLTFISAAIAHASAGDPASAILMPLVFLALLVVSYISYVQLHRQEAAHRVSPTV